MLRLYDNVDIHNKPIGSILIDWGLVKKTHYNSLKRTTVVITDYDKEYLLRGRYDNKGNKKF